MSKNNFSNLRAGQKPAKFKAPASRPARGPQAAGPGGGWQRSAAAAFRKPLFRWCFGAIVVIGIALIIALLLDDSQASAAALAYTPSWIANIQS